MLGLLKKHDGPNNSRYRFAAIKKVTFVSANIAVQAKVSINNKYFVNCPV